MPRDAALWYNYFPPQVEWTPALSKYIENSRPVLDLRGLKCPLPAMKTRLALARLAPGEGMIVLATDPMSAIDIPHAASQAGARLVGQRLDGGVLIFELVRDRQV